MASHQPTFDDIPISALQPSPTREPAPPQSHISPPERPNLFSILCDALGGDISQIAVPVFFNEPISFLQRLAEDIEYHHLLDKAAQPHLAATPDRAALVAAFIVSQYASTADRASKPFNPLLGETYELVLPHRGIALIAEQVSHHPPVSAIFVKGNGWTYHTALQVKSNMSVNSIEAWPEGTVHIHFDNSDHFMFEKPHTYVNNLFIGNTWIDNAGKIIVRNHKFITTINMKRASTLPFRERKGLGQLTGSIVSATAKSRTLRTIKGNWTSHVSVDGRRLWQVTPRPPSSHTTFTKLSAWAWHLNSPLASRNCISLPKTDSRRRPDQRALEQGNHALASSEKSRLECEQRDRRKNHHQGNKLVQPRWFELRHEPATGRKEWKYRQHYFHAKNNASAEWPHDHPDIF
ncbi:Oxysterol-binding protein-related protein 2B [Gracilariopsis chorda]|uniref:Oxysterol-binding protein-related protein 2B n=1 Tax=Gracilariopsis chorda TaxID=448386 RepID=A0A2V3IMW3_9FLOR|nr:Oxysterol-binding protein-related protein 2B [Gracilariopsis chorda]|eukprot:PXF43424.1 Oxysterol-binding protein-related protein 2B [Gracilariopsis chorda]